MNPLLVFDIETIPDIAGLRKLYELDAKVSDNDVAEMAFQMRRQKTGTDFIQHHLQRVAAIVERRVKAIGSRAECVLGR